MKQEKKYIDAEELISILERQNVDKKVLRPLIQIIENLRQKPVPKEVVAERISNWIISNPERFVSGNTKEIVDELKELI